MPEIWPTGGQTCQVPLNFTLHSLQGCVVLRAQLDSGTSKQSQDHRSVSGQSLARRKGPCQAESSRGERAASGQTRQPRNNPHTSENVLCTKRTWELLQISKAV